MSMMQVVVTMLMMESMKMSSFVVCINRLFRNCCTGKVIYLGGLCNNGELKKLADNKTHT